MFKLFWATVSVTPEVASCFSHYYKLLSMFVLTIANLLLLSLGSLDAWLLGKDHLQSIVPRRAL